MFVNEYDLNIESTLSRALELLNEERYDECKKHLKKAQEEFQKANTDEELKYLKSLEDSLK